MQKISFIGSGNMATALAKLILSKKIAKEIVMSDKNQEKLSIAKKNLKIKTAKSNIEAAKSSDIVFLSVKPQDIPEVLDEISAEIKNQLIVSIAAGITLSFLQSKLKKARIIRVMPNIACLAGEMAAGFSLGKFAEKKDGQIIKNILDSAGKSFLVEEEKLDAVTAISGSGPAFIAYFLDAMIASAISNGLGKEQATLLAEQTALGTAKLMLEKQISPEELIKMVASKGGTTEAGLIVFEQNNLKQTIKTAISKAVERSRKLGK